MKAKLWIARVLNLLGICITLGMIVMCVPFTVPKLLGYQIYTVDTESMEPEYPVGSVIYVKNVTPQEVAVGDVITYTLGTATDYVMTHRVVEIDQQAQTYITKGDANQENDIDPIAFSRLQGVVTFKVDNLGKVPAFLYSRGGIATIIGGFALVIVLWMLAGKLKTDAEKEPVPETEEERENRRKWNKRIGAGIGIGIMAVALVGTFLVMKNYRDSEKTYTALAETYLVQEIEGQEKEQSDTWWYEDVTIDFTELQKENGDIVAWIRSDTIDSLNYPVMYTGEDETYLRTDLYGNPSIAGSIFLEGQNSPDFEDLHTILYGHNMRNKTMFGCLKDYQEDGFWEENQYLTVYTKDGAYRYRVFGYQHTEPVGLVYTIGYQSDNIYQDFLNELIRNSYLDYPDTVTNKDHVITLSTCSGSSNRFVVHAVRVDEHIYEAALE